MPRLLLFVPCEKPLVGADNSLSLISVLQSITISVSAGDLADTTKASRVSDWHIVTVWQREQGEKEGTRFEQLVTLTDPGGEMRLQVITEFEMTKSYHRCMGRIAGFPMLSADGECTLTVSVRHLGEKEWIPKGSYPLRVTVRHLTEARTPPASTNPRTH